VVVEHSAPDGSGAEPPLPSDGQAGQEHAGHAGPEAGDGQDPVPVLEQPPEAAGRDDEALPGAEGQPARRLPPHPGPDARLYRHLLRHTPVRWLPDRRSGGAARVSQLPRGGPTVVPEPLQR
jgi:hypothetical protein